MERYEELRELAAACLCECECDLDYRFELEGLDSEEREFVYAELDRLGYEG